VRGVSSRVAADPHPDSFSGARSAGPWAAKSAAAKLARVLVTTLAIIAGPLLASLAEGRRPLGTQHARGLQLRGSIAFNSDFQLRGSIR